MPNTSTKINMDNINWKAEKSSLVPIYKQIIDFIKTKISSGEWSIGNRLPTQVSIAKAFNVNISTIAKEVDAYVLSDEVYRGLNHTGNRFTKSVVDLYNKGISTSSISKTFALAGVRIGWVCANESVIEEFYKLRDYNHISRSLVDDYEIRTC